MKTKTLFTIVLMILSSSFVNSQSWQWIRNIGSTTSDPNPGIDEKVWDVKADSQGNTYVCGQIMEHAYISAVNGNGNSLPLSNWWSSGFGYSMFIAKFDCQGNTVWIKTAGAPDSYKNYASSLLLDDFGHLYVAGHIACIPGYSLYFFDSTYTNHIYMDMFLAKFDTSGNMLWKQFAGDGLNFTETYVPQMEFNSYGEIYIRFLCGFNGTIFQNYPVVQQSAYVARFDTSGNINQLFLIPLGAFGAMAVDQNNNLYFSGAWVGDSLVLGGQTYYNPKKYGPNSYIFKVVKFDSTGLFQWIYMFSDSTSTPPLGIGGGFGIVVDSTGIYTSGPTGTGVRCGNHVFNTIYFPGPVTQEVPFVLKLDFQGNPVWVTQGYKQYGGDFCGGTVMSSDQKIYFEANYGGKMVLGSDTVSTNFVNNMAIGWVDLNGQMLGGAGISTAGSNNSTLAMSADNNGNIFLGGALQGTISVPGITLPYFGGGSDGFIAKWGYTCSVGMEEHEPQQSGELVCYPNPFTDYINISNEGFISLEVYNYVGQLLHRQTVTSESNIRISTSQLPEGLYIIRATGKTGVKTAKVVK